MGAQAVQAPARWPAEALLMGLSSSQSRSERVFSIWLITGLFLYVTGFYLSPTSKGQYLTLYIGMILPALYFSFWRFRDYFLRPNNAQLWVFAAVLLLYLPSMWVSGDILDTLRKNLKHVIFVLSFAIAIRHGYLHYPSLMARLPCLLFISSTVALACFFIALAKAGITPGGNIGIGNLGENPNETGLALSVGLICLLSLWQQHPNKALLILAIPLCIAIYLAYSRAAFLGLAVTLPFAIVFYQGKFKLALIYLTMCALGATLICTLMALGYLDADQLLSRRPTVWDAFLSANPDFHWLWGAGLDGSVSVFSKTLGLKLEAHSLFFALWLRGGLFSLAVFIGLVAASVRQQQAGSSPSNVWLYILLFGLVTQFFEGIYPVRAPNSFWLYTWLPLLMLALRVPPANNSPTSQPDTER